MDERQRAMQFVKEVKQRYVLEKASIAELMQVTGKSKTYVKKNLENMLKYTLARFDLLLDYNATNVTHVLLYIKARDTKTDKKVIDLLVNQKHIFHIIHTASNPSLGILIQSFEDLDVQNYIEALLKPVKNDILWIKYFKTIRDFTLPISFAEKEKPKQSLTKSDREFLKVFSATNDMHEAIKKLGTSQQSFYKKMKKLKKSGIIKGYALVPTDSEVRKQVLKPIEVIFLLKINYADVDNVLKQMKILEKFNIINAHLIHDEYNFLIRIVMDSTEEIGDIYETLEQIKGIEDIQHDVVVKRHTNLKTREMYF